MLQNLGEMYQVLSNGAKEWPFGDVVLPDEFKRAYGAYLAEVETSESERARFEKVVWATYSAQLTTHGRKMIVYAPNYWFFAAVRMVDFIHALLEHKAEFENVFAGDDRHAVANSFKKHGDIAKYKQTIARYGTAHEWTKEATTNFHQFISNYADWGGGKTIDRGDFLVSAVLNGANLLAEASGGVVDLAYQLAHRPDLARLLKDLSPLESHPVAQHDESPAQPPLVTIPKPFLLLAGLSGTGKTRFVKEQAKAYQSAYPSNYCLVPVRPDWHEPSDLLGYVSRIGGVRFVVTDLLRFLACAWRDAAAAVLVTHTDILDSDGNKLICKEIVCKPPDKMVPHWLCLDEMNLAPVEQYFADYLAVLETREWKGGKYACEPLLQAGLFKELDEVAKAELRGALKMDGAANADLWAYFSTNGIPLPPNLIVAGTVNMDETTHGFSRKVIDRAFTIDFGEFYPNDYDHYFERLHNHKSLSFPLLTCATLNDLQNAPADGDGQKSIAFLKKINGVLKDTPFQLAFRGLNELLLAVVCFAPKDDAELHAVWDDFLMTKLLPRIDGDSDKLGSSESDKLDSVENSLLVKLSALLKTEIGDIWTGERADLLRERTGGGALHVDCRSRIKLDSMQKRLLTRGFTSFWP